MRFLLIFLVLSSVQLHAIVLKPVNIPENWKIESTEKTEQFKAGESEVPLMVRQTLSTPDGQVVISYYACPDETLRKNVFQYFFSQNQTVFQDQKMVYRLEGEPKDLKNVLRFLEISLKEQIKLIFEDLQGMENSSLEKEWWMDQAEVTQAGNEIGIAVLDGMVQIYHFSNSKAKLQARYFFCKNRNEALTGYKNARLKKMTDLVNYLFAEQLLVELTWIQ